jgi:hypothetical protein
MSSSGWRWGFVPEGTLGASGKNEVKTGKIFDVVFEVKKSITKIFDELYFVIPIEPPRRYARRRVICWAGL